MSINKEQAKARLSVIEDGLRTLNDEAAALRSIIEAPEKVEKKPLLPETILRVEMIISNGADLKDAAAWQAYAEAFNTILDLRRQPGTEPAEDEKEQWFIDWGGDVDSWRGLKYKLIQLCPPFDSEASALAARGAVGLDRILRMYNTLHGRGYEYSTPDSRAETKVGRGKATPRLKESTEEKEMMSDKMKAAFDEWCAVLEMNDYERAGAKAAHRWTLDYLRSQQEPHYFEFWAGAFDRCSKEQYESLPEGNRFKFYTHPTPSAPVSVPDGWLAAVEWLQGLADRQSSQRDSRFTRLIAGQLRAAAPQSKENSDD